MIPDAIQTADLELQGRVLPASNATFVADAGGVRVVYKPVAGERPLWDFPDGTLAAREVAAYELSHALGWHIVPPTLLRGGPHGMGMVQQWIDVDESAQPVTLVRAGQQAAGTKHIIDGLDERDRPVSLVHEDTAALRRMALFDAVVNNADRKGGHVLPLRDGHRFGVDHGLTFHADPKLRTVLWGWAGEPLTPDELSDLVALQALLAADLAPVLESLVTAQEVAAAASRLEGLISEATFPIPQDTGYPAIPWPPF